jgi:hypothetical protein
MHAIQNVVINNKESKQNRNTFNKYFTNKRSYLEGKSNNKHCATVTLFLAITPLCWVVIF